MFQVEKMHSRVFHILDLSDCPSQYIDLVRTLDEMPDTAHPQLEGRGQVFCFLELGNFKSLGNTGDLIIIGKSGMIRFSLISSMVSKNVHRM